MPLMWDKYKLLLIFYYSNKCYDEICQQITEYFPRINS